MDARYATYKDSTSSQDASLFLRPYDLAECRIADIKDNWPFRAGIEYTPPARGTWTIAHTPMLVPGAHEVYVCPGNCLRGVVLSAAEGGFSDRFSMIELSEDDLWNGQMEDLFIEGVTDCIDRLPRRPSCVFVVSSCVHELMGLDFSHVISELRRRFPGIDIEQSYMNCTMRRSKLGYEDVQWRQNYAALHPSGSPLDHHLINTIANYMPLERDSELFSMLAEGGYELREICRAKTYADYQAMAASWLDLYHWPVAAEAARDLRERLGHETFYLPFCWDSEEIRGSFARLAELCCVVPPDFDALESAAEASLARARESLGNAEICVDATATPRPFGLAQLLLMHGFNVTEVYSDVMPAGDEKAFSWLRQHCRGLLVSAMVNFRLRRRPRNAAQRAAKKGRKVVAVGQRAAYFADTPYFVNMIANDGLLGFAGISKFAEYLIDASRHPKDTRHVIQVKARGIENYRLTRSDNV